MNISKVFVSTILCFFCLPAMATHGSWVLSEPGMSCRPVSGSTEITVDRSYGFYKVSGDNGFSSSRLNCPITLAGRFSPISESSRGQLTARARYAAIDVIDYHKTKDISCTPLARFKGMDEEVAGAAVKSQGTGSQRLVLRYDNLFDANDKEWGGELQQYQHRELESLSYFCEIPQPDPNNLYTPSAIVHYTVALCYNDSGSCYVENRDGKEGRGVPYGRVLVSPASCFITNGASPRREGIELRRFGLSNIGEGSSFLAPSIVCPLSVPAQDSYSHWLTVKSGMLSMSGDGGVDCVLGYPDPETGVLGGGSIGFKRDLVDYYLESTLESVPTNSSPILQCQLKPGQTFMGAEFSITRSEINRGA